MNRKGPMGTDQAFKPTPPIMGGKMKKKAMPKKGSKKK
jgi:hypothetical protein